MKNMRLFLLFIATIFFLYLAMSAYDDKTETFEKSDKNKNVSINDSNKVPIFPKDWGPVPTKNQTKDLVQFPKPYDEFTGSSTVKLWIMNSIIKSMNLIGLSTCEAQQLIQDSLEVDVELVLNGSFVTEDYRIDRVRIYHENNIVIKQPKIG